MEIILSLRGISKSFSEVEALRAIDLEVYRGEFLTLLGPSGCGKTTSLRIIAGLERPSTGQVWLDGEDITSFAPNKRNVNTVFQSYALFPHMSVFQNIAYGLRVKGVKKNIIKEKVHEMLEMVQLPDFDRRMPGQLSGGQRQRVAIARAMINNPCILLLDEPLGALDLQLRRQMQEELKRIQKSSGITFIYITHDQEEALNMSDRIAVMNAGRIEQIGAPDDIYERPGTRFTAQFIGQANLFEAKVLRIEGAEAVLAFAGGEARVADASLAPGSIATISIRAERLDYNTQENWPGFSVRGVVMETRYAGGSMRTTLKTANGQLLTVSGLTREDRLADGTAVNLYGDPKHTAVIPEEQTGEGRGNGTEN